MNQSSNDDPIPVSYAPSRPTFRVLVAECMQEISSFNPLPSQFDNFTIETGEVLLAHRGLNTSIAGALAVFAQRSDVTVVPTIAARAGSAGALSAAGWARLRSDIVAAIVPHVGSVEAIYLSLHGAMGAEGEPDPEGDLLDRVRELFGDDLPIVVSLDLHGVLTDRMLRQIDGLTLYHTYPHVDFADTGSRAAHLLLDILDRGLHPVIARVTVPMLARGDECITRTGLYGDILADARLLERQGAALAAGVMIGNPFTDVPELCTQAIVVAESDAAFASAAATALAESIWAGRHRLVGKLVPLTKAVELAKYVAGPVVFTDAADCTSSGASGDSNAIIRALQAGDYRGRVLAQIIDPTAAQAAHAAGVGAEISVDLGGAHDRRRFVPITVTARIESLSRGHARLETMGLPIDAGPSAVLTFTNFTVLVMSHTVHLFDRAMYFANGLDPHAFDLIMVKSPHTEFHMYDQWASKNFNVDAPGSSSANLVTLGHRLCIRPIYPLEPETTFLPQPVLYRRGPAPLPRP